MAHEKVYGICEDKCREEVYSKSETYSKSEVYSKSETYSKSEVYSKSEADNKYELPVGTIIMLINGSTSVPPYGTWIFVGSLEDITQDPEGEFITLAMYKRTA